METAYLRVMCYVGLISCLPKFVSMEIFLKELFIFRTTVIYGKAQKPEKADSTESNLITAKLVKKISQELGSCII